MRISDRFRGLAGVYLRGPCTIPTHKDPVTMTVSQISSRRPSRLLSAGSWLVALVIVLVPAVSGCDDSAAHEAAPASAAATTPAAVARSRTSSA